MALQRSQVKVPRKDRESKEWPVAVRISGNIVVQKVE